MAIHQLKMFPQTPEKTFMDPKNPVIPTVDNKYDVGSIDGSLNVNGLGAAEFTIQIEAPLAGPLMPSLSLTYNSQNATNGVAGYGVSLSGLSAITRGEKNIFNNNKEIAGITYSETDDLFLDGKRLILVSGLPCQEGAMYCIEGDPYTKITAHGQYNGSNVTTWFEVKTPDGMTYQYGKTSDSKLTFRNNAGLQRIASWHINQTVDLKGNYMTVSYLQDNYYPYPLCVYYGMNSVKDRGLKNKIEFTYEDLGASQSFFFLEDRKGFISKRIATITTSSNNQVFRKYFLTYDVTSDKSTCRFARLTSIREENGKGDSLTPTKLIWTPLTDGSRSISRINDPMLKVDTSISLDKATRVYTAADVTGDGVSDIILLASGKETIQNKIYNRTFVIISRSKVKNQNEVYYEAPIVYRMPTSISFSPNQYTYEASIGTFNLSDIDGDGINDLVFPYRQSVGNSWNTDKLYPIYGKDIVSGNTKSSNSTVIPINPTNTPPIYTACDFDGDGIDEVLCMETSAVNGLYQASTIKIYGDLDEAFSKRCNLEIPGKPEKVFCADFNNDGLIDIIVLHKDGYKIFYNIGGKVSDIHFDTSMSKSGSSMKDQTRIDVGDFNGDGLADFVYNIEGESSIRVAYNNGDGTFNNTYSYDVGLSKKVKKEPANHFLLRSIDLDRDGRSDVLVSKATYELKSNEPVFKETQIRWLKSDGAGLIQMKSFTKTREDDANENLIFIGDFDGDGYIDLANSGSMLDR